MPRKKYVINENQLTKGEIRKLNALRKSVGDDIADKAFLAWHRKMQTEVREAVDPNIEVIEGTLGKAIDRLHFPRGGRYEIRRGRGRVIVNPAE
ncbi:MAG: hypothetical protein ACE5MK_09000 [Acidobacteriota bacterium]